MNKFIPFLSVLIFVFTSNSFARRITPPKETLRKEQLRESLRQNQKLSTSLRQTVREELMKDIAIRDFKISETEVVNFLKTSAKKDQEVKAFYSFILKEGRKPPFWHIRSLFINWVILNTKMGTPFEAVSGKQLGSMVRELSHKEISQLNEVFELARLKMDKDNSLTADIAFVKVMEEKGIKADKLRKCER